MMVKTFSAYVWSNLHSGYITDIRALSSNLYLWLKNKAKIHILIHTLVLEN